MRSITPVVIALALCAAAAPADSAGNAARPDRYEACMDASGGVTVEMLDCAEVELSWLNSRLNGHYGEAMAMLPADQRVALRDVQRAWIRYRDLDCGFLNDQTLAGTSGRLLQSACLIDKTRMRVGVMKDIEARVRMLFKGEVAD